MALALGIDIQGTRLYACAIRTSLRRIQNVRFFEVDLGADIDSKREAVENLFRDPELRKADVAVNFKGTIGSLRRLELPIAALKKLDDVIPFELESLVPFDSGSLQLDYQWASPKTDSLIFPWVASVPKTRMREELSRLLEMGLDPDWIGLGPSSLSGLRSLVPSVGQALTTLPANGESVPAGATAFLHVGSEVCEIGIFDKNELIFGRTLACGTDLAGAVDRICGQVVQTLVSFESAHEHAVQNLFVTGAQSHMMVTPLRHAVSVPNIDTLVIPLPAGTPPVLDTERYGFAYALAQLPTLRAKVINLRKGEFERKRSRDVVKKYAWLLAAGLTLIALSFVFSVGARYWVLKAQRAELDVALAAAGRTAVGREFHSVDEVNMVLRGNSRGRDPLPTFTAYDAVLALTNAVPAAIRAHDVQRLHVDLGDDRSGGRFDIQATVNSLEEADQIRDRITAVPCFREVEVGSTNPTADGRRQYSIEGEIMCGEPPARARRSGGQS